MVGGFAKNNWKSSETKFSKSVILPKFVLWGKRGKRVQTKQNTQILSTTICDFGLDICVVPILYRLGRQTQKSAHQTDMTLPMNGGGDRW